MIVHVIGGHERNTRLARKFAELFEPDRVRDVIGQLGGEEEVVAEDVAVGVEGAKRRRNGGTKGM